MRLQISEPKFISEKPVSQFPELFITVPDSWNKIQLAPFYDVHVGAKGHDRERLKRHLDWVAETPDVICWNGGDFFDNLVDPKMGRNTEENTDQFYETLELLAPIAHKFAFAIPGNHEARTYRTAQIDIARIQADALQIPYFPDYAFVTFEWRGNRFKLAAHHGTGGAQTAGAQRNSARKDLLWMKPDILWTGHLHQPIADLVQIHDYDQVTGMIFERDIFVIISPSYLQYYGTYAAAKRLAPGSRGMSVAILHEDGRIDVSLHAKGRRL